MAAIPSIETLLNELTLEEKAWLCTGRDFWHLQSIERFGLEAIMVTDGPHGMRKADAKSDAVGLSMSVKATCFPTASGLAATWNRSLIQQMGIALGKECRAENVSVLLGPGVNLKRNPLGGRNFEYFSEDPYISGQLASAWIDGVQSQQVGASLKHYAVNNHEHSRMVCDAIVDERTIREIYLPGFESAVKQSQPWTVMCAYNKLNGTYLSENKKMLTDILQKEWGYKGMVVTDWMANNDRVAGIKAGQHLDMPGSGDFHVLKITNAVNSNELSMVELDHSVARVLQLIVEGQESQKNTQPVDLDEHHQLAADVAAEACVLLKNDHQLLPMATGNKVAVIGSLATHPRYQGAGSSQINPYKLEQPLEVFRQALGEDHVLFSEGYALKGDLTDEQKRHALETTERADIVVLIAGLTPELESEGFDRQHINLPQQQLDLIAALQPAYDKLVVVLQNGAPVAMPFADQVPAIIEAYLGGQAGARGLVQVLTGAVNPSGKLAETFPLSLDTVPSQPWFPGTYRQAQYREGIWVGYRYFDHCNVPVLFPFGHGMSYTRFDYGELVLSGDNFDSQSDAFSLGEAQSLTVQSTITNSGKRAGAEVVQLYVGQPDPGVPRPDKELKGFDKVFLQPGERKTVTFTLLQRDFAYWSVEDKDWRTESDRYNVFVAASVSDVRLQQSIQLHTGVVKAERSSGIDVYYNPKPLQFNDASFTALLGHDIPAPVATRPYHANTIFAEIQDHWLGRKLFNVLKKQFLAKIGGDTISEANRLMVESVIKELPLRNVAILSEGKVSDTNLSRLIHLLNNDYFKALMGTKAASR